MPAPEINGLVLRHSRDCPIFYRRKKAQKDMAEAKAQLDRWNFWSLCECTGFHEISSFLASWVYLQLLHDDSSPCPISSGSLDVKIMQQEELVCINLLKRPLGRWGPGVKELGSFWSTKSWVRSWTEEGSTFLERIPWQMLPQIQNLAATVISGSTGFLQKSRSWLEKCPLGAASHDQRKVRASCYKHGSDS